MQSSQTRQSELLGSGSLGIFGDIAQADLTPRLCDQCRAAELVKESYRDPGAEALLAI